MIEEFELALTDNRDLDQVAQALISRADHDRHDRLREIRRDLDFCKLIRAGLTEQPDTGPYMISRAFVRMYRKKHYPGGTYKLAAELMQDDDEKKGVEHDDDQRKQTNFAGSATSGTGSANSATISTPISAE